MLTSQTVDKPLECVEGLASPSIFFAGGAMRGNAEAWSSPGTPSYSVFLPCS